MKIECYTGGFFQTNSYLLQGDGGNTLIDAPQGAAEWLRGKGVEINELLLTHLHHDHVIDAAAIQREHSSCRVRSHSAYDDDLTLASLLRHAVGGLADLESFESDELLEGQTTITSVGFEFALKHVPGHSPDSLCFYLAGENDINPGTPILFGGDVLFNGGIGRTDFPNGSTELLLDGIREKVLTLPGDTVVYPGHGPETTVADEASGNPFLTGNY
ncbi:MAG: MBL fold metallo-hydrolase [Verrucomicrobia bacterium]|nr:MBL fold metallo-hydrolase [Verrucomicrobiota bacterium]